jgi:L-amino acid N-acyltransferase YncA
VVPPSSGAGRSWRNRSDTARAGGIRCGQACDRFAGSQPRDNDFLHHRSDNGDHYGSGAPSAPRRRRRRSAHRNGPTGAEHRHRYYDGPAEHCHRIAEHRNQHGHSNRDHPTASAVRATPLAAVLTLVSGTSSTDSDWKTTGMQAISSIVRPASPQDAAACVAIYRPYVLATAISWELEVPTVAEMAARIAAARETHEWLVLERDEQIIGMAYAHGLKARLPSYLWTVETGIYVDVDHHRTGGGRKLYAQLLRRLTERGYRRAFAGITQPNEASNRFHRSFGFQDAGLYRRVAWKHDSWHDVVWMHLDLLDTADQDAPPRPIT